MQRLPLNHLGIALALSFSIAACGGTSEEEEEIKFSACGAETDNEIDGTVDSYTNYIYDERGNPLRDEVDQGLDGTIDSLATMTHDDNDNMTSYYSDIQNDGTFEDRFDWTYDDRSNMLSERTEFEGSTANFRQMEYDDDDKLTRELVDNDDDGNFDFISEFNYDGDRLATVVHEDGAGVVGGTDTYVYDGDGKLIRIDYSSLIDGTETIYQVDTIEEDVHGNIAVRQRDSDNDGTIDATFRRTYNADNRLTLREDDITGDGLVDIRLRLTYDEDGKALTFELSGELLGAQLTTYLYDCSTSRRTAPNVAAIEGKALLSARDARALEAFHRLRRERSTR